jgi:NitT/TauT family transport system substrate-binding protein
LLKILAGLLPKTEGQIFLRGEQVNGPRRDIGVVFQNPVLLPWRTVLENVLLPAQVLHYRHNWFYPVVLADSPIKEIKDFKGKIIGVQAMGASMVPFMKAMVAEAGLDPEKDVTLVAAGLGAGAAALLAQKKIDILALWAGQYALMENEGFKFRKFDQASPLDVLTFCLPFVATEEFVKKNPEAVVGLGRGFAKGTVFALTNPEAAVKIHWKIYPESKPSGEREEIGIQKALHELRSATEFMRIDNTKLKKWGATTREEIETYADFLVRTKILDSKPADPYAAFSDEFIEKINQFDSGKVIAQAREFK